jgi:hypothetical protein
MRSHLVPSVQSTSTPAPPSAELPVRGCHLQVLRFFGQVKATTLKDGSDYLPDRIPGAVWKPQQDQIAAGIFHGLYIAGFRKSGRLVRIDYVPGHILEATPQVFEPRAPLKSTAKRAGWTGFTYNLKTLPAVGFMPVYRA